MNIPPAIKAIVDGDYSISPLITFVQLGELLKRFLSYYQHPKTVSGGFPEPVQSMTLGLMNALNHQALKPHFGKIERSTIFKRYPLQNFTPMLKKGYLGWSIKKLLSDEEKLISESDLETDILDLLYRLDHYILSKAKEKITPIEQMILKQIRSMIEQILKNSWRRK